MTELPRARVTVELAYPPERVFDAWLAPATVGRWMFGPAVRDERIIHLQVDATIGGAFSFLVERAGQRLQHLGEYSAIERPNRLEFTWGVRHGDDGAVEFSRVMVAIAATDSGSVLTIVHEMDPAWSAFTDKAAAAWAHMAGKLDEALRGCESTP